MVVISSGEGMGKGTLDTMMKKIIGAAHHLSTSDRSVVMGEFSGARENKVAIFIDEMQIGGAGTSNAQSHEAAQIRNAITSDTETSRPMYHDPVVVRSLSNFFHTTNLNQNWSNAAAIGTSTDSRRFCVHKIDPRPLFETKWACSEFPGDSVKARLLSFFHRLYANFDPVVNTFANLLYNYPLDGWSATPPITRALVDQRLTSLAPLQRWYHDCLVSGANSFDTIKLTNKNAAGAEVVKHVQTPMWKTHMSMAELKRSYGKQTSNYTISDVRQYIHSLTLPEPNIR